MILLKFEKHIKGGAKVDNYIDWIEVQTYALIPRVTSRTGALSTIPVQPEYQR